VLHSGKLWPYSQSIDLAGKVKVCEGKTPKFISNIMARNVPYSGAPEKHFTQVGSGRKGLPWTSTLAYYKNS
jgi:hypothetical protein